MVTLIGDGGHAAVIRDLIRARERLDKTFEAEGTIIAVGNNHDRKREAEKRKGTRFTYLIHPSATVASSALIGMGTVIMAGAIVQAGASTGQHCIVNTSAVLDHHATLGDFVHLAPGSVVCGGARIGEGAMIGANASVLPNTHVPAWYLLSANKCFHYGKVKTEESFWAKVQKSDGCWEWMAAKNHNGYGIVSKRSGNQLAHRVAWIMVRGAIPFGRNVLHRCDNPPCVNPDHLFLGTQAENITEVSGARREEN